MHVHAAGGPVFHVSASLRLSLATLSRVHGKLQEVSIDFTFHLRNVKSPYAEITRQDTLFTVDTVSLRDTVLSNEIGFEKYQQTVVRDFEKATNRVVLRQLGS